MEISTLIAGSSFGAVLASLAVVPNLVRIFLERRLAKQEQNPQHRVGAFSNPTPFNYPQIYVSEVPLTALASREKDDHLKKATKVDGLLPFPAPVPFNYPRIAVRKP